VAGLYVVEQAADFRAIDAELGRIDSRLFLSWELERGKKLYRVLYERGDLPPLTLCDWRDERGEPLPLSSGLIERVKSQRPRGGPEFPDYARLNEERAEKERVELGEAMQDIAADIEPRIAGRRLPLFHRGIHLRRARRGG